MRVDWNFYEFREAAKSLPFTLWCDVPAGAWCVDVAHKTLVLKGPHRSLMISLDGNFKQCAIMDLDGSELYVVSAHLKLYSHENPVNIYAQNCIAEDTTGMILITWSASDYWYDPKTGVRYRDCLSSQCPPDDRPRDKDVLQLAREFRAAQMVLR